MKTTITTISIIFTFFSFSQTSAIYKIVLISNWEAHGTLPSGSHFTELVGTTHNSNITFVEMGSMATLGIEDVAEIGDFTQFNIEVDDAISNNNAKQFIVGPNLFFNQPLRTITINNLTVNSDFPLISFVSMIAPSPDWMIAINSLSLLDNGNQWINEIIMDLFPYDAGTEEGSGYSLNNSPTVPQGNITSLQGIPPFNSQTIATITITLQSVLDVDDNELTNNVKLAPNPTQGLLEISASNSNPIQKIIIYDILGKQIKKITSNNQITKLDISEFHKGIYIIKLHFEDSTTITRKIVKN